MSLNPVACALPEPRKGWGPYNGAAKTIGAALAPGKPHHGRIANWHRLPCDGGLGYLIIGVSFDHPIYGGSSVHTSYVVAHDRKTGEIRTRNSRYSLVGAETN
jgi:hypothetical protein